MFITALSCQTSQANFPRVRPSGSSPIPSPEPADIGEPKRRQGGQWKGQVIISSDFDELPDDLAEAFGVRTP